MLYINILRDLAAVYIAFDQLSSLAYAIAKLSLAHVTDWVITIAVLLAQQPEPVSQTLSFIDRWGSF